MLIESRGKYEIIARDFNGLVYQWNITIIPTKRAWKLVNKSLNIGDILNNCYEILSLTRTYDHEKSTTDLIQYSPETDTWEGKRDDISEEDFNFSVQTSGIHYAATPMFNQSYRCDICGGIVANDMCTSCMFDWNS